MIESARLIFLPPSLNTPYHSPLSDTHTHSHTHPNKHKKLSHLHTQRIVKTFSSLSSFFVIKRNKQTKNFKYKFPKTAKPIKVVSYCIHFTTVSILCRFLYSHKHLFSKIKCSSIVLFARFGRVFFVFLVNFLFWLIFLYTFFPF